LKRKFLVKVGDKTFPVEVEEVKGRSLRNRSAPSSGS
jgi:hypothetical protein